MPKSNVQEEILHEHYKGMLEHFFDVTLIRETPSEKGKYHVAYSYKQLVCKNKFVAIEHKTCWNVFLKFYLFMYLFFSVLDLHSCVSFSPVEISGGYPNRSARHLTAVAALLLRSMRSRARGLR